MTRFPRNIDPAAPQLTTPPQNDPWSYTMTRRFLAPRASFEQWLDEVNALLWQLTDGLDLDDLPDMPTARWYAEGLSSDRAARRAIKLAQTY